MPRPSRRSKGRRRGNYGQLREHLLTGSCLHCLIFEHPEACTEDELHETWEREKDELVREWAREHPGTRPFMWWKFDAPAPRRRERVDGKCHPHDHALRKLHVAKSDNPDYWRRAYRLHFGLPGIFIFPFDDDLYHDWWNNLFRGKESQVFEPEWSFLVRHNLLLPEDSP
jgi:hypothetical protein